MPIWSRFLDAGSELVGRRPRFVVDGLAWATLAIVVAGAIAHARLYDGITIDEAFSTFRHSLNLVSGRGFSCSAGDRVECTSSPLFALLMGIPIAMGVEPYPAATFLGILAFALCTVAAYLAAQACLDDRGSRLLGLGAAALVAASPTLAYHSQTGMETPIYACAVSIALWLHLRDMSAPKQGTMGWAIAMGLAALLQPEGATLFLALLTVSVGFRIRSAGVWRQALRELCAFGSIWIPWILFRAIYFGQWPPDLLGITSEPVVSAAGVAPNGLLDTLTHDAGTPMLQYTASHRLGVGLLAGTTLMARTRHAGVAVVAITLASLAAVTWRGANWMTHDRMLAPCITPLAVGTALGMRGLLFHDEQRTKHGHLLSVVAALAAFALVLSNTWQLPPPEIAAANNLSETRELGSRLAAVTRPDDLVASELVGRLPYYWGARTVDLFGRRSARIARPNEPPLLAIARVDWDFLTAKRPTWYAFQSASGAASFYQQPAFAPQRNDYYLVQFPYGYLSSSRFCPPTLLVRKDRRDVQQIARKLGIRLVDAGNELRRTGFLR